jgi:hypothetical protein
VLPKTLTSIGDYAFSGCSGLSYLLFNGATEPKFSSNPFQSCSKLSYVKVSMSYSKTTFCNLKIHYIGVCGLNANWEFGLNDGNMIIEGKDSTYDYNYKVETPWESLKSKITSLVIKSEISGIGNWCFYNCYNLDTLSIYSNLKTIGSFAFSCCSNLTSFDFPSSLTTIGKSAFYGCTTLSSLSFSSNTTSIQDAAFFDCLKIISVVYYGYKDPGLNSQYVFENCTELTVKVIKYYHSDKFCGLPIIRTIDGVNLITQVCVASLSCSSDVKFVLLTLNKILNK